MATLDELLQQLGFGGVTRNRAGQIVGNTSDVIPVATAGLADTLYGAGRGTLTGTAAIGGIPGDINQMYVNKFGALYPNELAPPTSEQISQAVRKAVPPLNLSRDNTGNVATSLGENLVSPMVAPESLLSTGSKTAKYAAPVVGNALENYASRTGLLMPLNTYHGSRYPFNEFDLSKIGTGEGSQIQGHGVYLAEVPGTARQYAAIAYKPGLQQGSAFASDMSRLDAVIKLNASNFTGGDVSKLADVIKRAPTAFKNPDAMLERIATYTNNNPTGYLYTVDLPDKYIPKMLDYDEPIKNQHKVVRDFAKKQGLSMDDTGFDLLQKVGRDKAGADLMQSAGIPGVKYADQMRLGEEGNRPRNFVVFNPKNIKIIERKKVNE